MSPKTPADHTEIAGVRNTDPVEMFLYAIRAEETRRQYMSKLKAFFDHLGLKGTLEEQAG